MLATVWWRGEHDSLVPTRVAQVDEDVAEVVPVAVDEVRTPGVGHELVAARERGLEVDVGTEVRVGSEVVNLWPPTSNFIFFAWKAYVFSIAALTASSAARSAAAARRISAASASASSFTFAAATSRERVREEERGMDRERERGRYRERGTLPCVL
jgi:hypothetical protein